VGTVSNVVDKRSTLPTITHPHYKRSERDWFKWRLTYESGDRFIRQYLVKFSNREDNREFQERRKLAYCPAFAKAAIHEVRNAIYKRSTDITREGGPASYQEATTGKRNGVDLLGSSMNYFMGVKVLEEVLVMGRVGVYVDMPSDIGVTLLEKKGKRPYIYMYQAEDIRSWTVDQGENGNEFTSLLLCDHDYEYDDITNLPTDEVVRYRYLYIKQTEAGPRVFCKFCDDAGCILDEYNEEADDDYEIQVGNLDRIPFILIDIQNSLLADAANYQIAHLNIASGDIWYAARANYPFYIEPFDPKSQSPYIKQAGNDDFASTDQFTMVTNTTNAEEITTGPTRGRRYPIGLNQPAFIHPSPEPLRASMAKQDQLKAELRQLINLSLSSLNPTSGSAQSKALDQAGLENGLTYLAMILQYAEERIGLFWSLYEGTTSTPEIQYPEQYQLLDPDQIDKEIDSLTKLCDRTTSMTLKRRCMKIIAELKVSSYVQRAELEKIYREIDNADVIVADVASIKIDVEAGLVSNETASIARGYPKGEADKAAEDHASRLARIQEAQTPKIDAQARGINDLSIDPKAGSKEKAAVADQTTNPNPTDPTRGPGQNGQ